MKSIKKIIKKPNVIKYGSLFLIFGLMIIFAIPRINNIIKEVKINMIYKTNIAIKDAAKRYVMQNPDLPVDEDGFVIISTQTLIKNNMLNEDAANKFTASINEIFKESTIQITKQTKIKVYLKNKLAGATVKEGAGLYDLNNELVFKGIDVNNYIKYNDELWRIVKIDQDGDIKIIAENIIAKDKYVLENNLLLGNSFGSSNAKNILNDYILTLSVKSRNQNMEKNLCVAARDENETSLDSEIECQDILAGESVSLLQANEYMLASLDETCAPYTKSCANQNYLNIGKEYFTITPQNNNTNDRIWNVYEDGVLSSKKITDESGIRPVIILDGLRTFYLKGDGSKDNPYIFN